MLEIVQEAGKVGVTTSEVMSRAGAKGRVLKANSVASMLSRFKQDGALVFDGERYYQLVLLETTAHSCHWKWMTWTLLGRVISSKNAGGWYQGPDLDGASAR